MVSGWLLKELVEEIDIFIECYGDKLDDEFKSWYGFDFLFELWEMIFYDFLMMVCRFVFV